MRFSVPVVIRMWLRSQKPARHVWAAARAAASAKSHAADNLALLRKLTLNLLRHDQTIKDTMRGKRIRAALCGKTLETPLKLNI